MAEQNVGRRRCPALFSLSPGAYVEREDFRSRLDKGQPISVHELLYPLLTAIDAVKLQSDVELGATEQNSTCSCIVKFSASTACRDKPF